MPASTEGGSGFTFTPFYTYMKLTFGIADWTGCTNLMVERVQTAYITLNEKTHSCNCTSYHTAQPMAVGAL